MSNTIIKLEGVVINTLTGKELHLGDVVDLHDTLLVQSGSVTIDADGKSYTFNQGAFIDMAMILFNEKSADIEAGRIEQGLIDGGKDATAAINALNETEAAAAGGATDEGSSTPLVINFDNTQGFVDSGYPTGPISYAFPTPPPELPPIIEIAAVIEPPPPVENTVTPAPDTNWAQEDGSPVAIGNVLENLIHNGAPSESLFGDNADTQTGDAPALTVVATITTGTYGTLVLTNNGDYTYTLDGEAENVQALAQGEQVTENFVYTVTDGTIVTTGTLTVTIFGTNDTPIIHVDDEGSPARGQVQEDVTFATSGQLSATDVDHGATATWSVTGDTSSVYGTFGVDQTGQWTYTLDNGTDGVAGAVQALADGQSVVETYTVRVTDDHGAVADQVVTITIVGTNDAPTVTGDVGAVSEDGVLVASGDIVFGDIDTTDVNTLSVTSTDGSVTQSIVEGSTSTVTVSGIYGSLTLDQAGHWVYTLNNEAENVQALAGGQEVTETFPVSYSDTGEDNNTIVITITGTNDAPKISIGQSAIVSEEALPTGNPDVPVDITDVTVVHGQFVISDVDSTSLGVSLTAPIIAYTSGNLPITWETSDNGHTLTGSTIAGIVVTVNIDDLGAYTVTLLGAIDHAAPPPGTSVENTLDIEFGVTVSDGDLSASSTLVVTIEDDIPNISADNVAIPNEIGIYTGEYSFNIGADVQPFSASFGEGSLLWTDARSGFSETLTYNAGASTDTSKVYDATYLDGTTVKTFFSIAVNSDGTYDFNLVTPDPVVTTEVTGLLQGIVGNQSQIPSYTFDSSLFAGLFNLVATGYSGAAHTADTLTISAIDLGVGDNVMQGNKHDVLRLDIQPTGSQPVSISELHVDLATTAGVKVTDYADLTVYYTDGTHTLQSQQIGNDYALNYTISTGKIVDYVELTPHDTSVSFKVIGLSLDYVVKEFPGDYDLNFALSGTDFDLDTASTTFTVAVNAATPDTTSYVIDGTSGNDNIYGTSGSDILVGHAGHDIFILDPASLKDTIQDFTLAATASGVSGPVSADNSDVLNIHDLLTISGITDFVGNESKYLSFVADGINTKVMFDADGTGAGVATQVATLEGIAITDPAALLNSLVQHDQIVA